MSLYETLKAAKIGAAPDVFTTLRAQIAPFAKGGSTQTVKELEDTPPLSFKANGEPLIDWSIRGKSGGVGDKSKNLFDGTYTKGFIGTTYVFRDTGTQANCAIIPCEPSTTYTVKKIDESNRFAIGTSSVYPYDEMTLTGVYYLDTATSYTFTTDSSAEYMVIYISTGSEQAEPRLMVNEGQETDYEPYGFKIPITCGGETNTIYLNAPLGASDSISMTDTGISIPTVDGSNTLSVGTTVQPSSVYIKYKE